MSFCLSVFLLICLSVFMSLYLSVFSYFNSILFFIRGFMKYEREKTAYRNAKTRQNDWNEIYDTKTTRKGLKRQAAR